MDQVAMLEDVKKHVSSLKMKRARLDTVAPVIARLLFSITPDLTNQKTPQLTVNNELYDGSGMQVLKIWAAGIVGGTCDRDGDWAHLRFRDNKLNTLPGVPTFEKDTEDLSYSLLDQSDFYEWAYQLAHTAGWYCTAAGTVELKHKTKTLAFKELPPGSYWIDEDADGVVNVMYREFEMAAWEIKESWANLPDAYRKELDRDDYAMHTVAQLVRPRKKFRQNDIGNQNFAFQNLYLANGNQIVLEESGFREFPFIVYRVARIHGTPWGGGPGMDMIRDGQIQQAVAETMLLADEKMVNPAMKGPQELSSEDVQTHPGAFNFWPKEFLEAVEPLNQGINRPVGMDREAILRQTLERHYSVDTFLSQSRSTTAKTATEAMGIQNEQNNILAPTFASWTSQVFDVVFRRVFDALIAFKLMPQPPAVLADMYIAPIDVKYVGPSATIRKRYRSVTGVENLANTTRLLKTAFPELAAEINDNADIDVLMTLAIEGAGVEVAKVDDDTKSNNRATRRKALAMQAQAQAMQQAGPLGSGGAQ